jgi:Fic family protein
MPLTGLVLVGSSTRIEGVKLTNSEIESLLRGIKTYSFRSCDEQEVAGYAEVMEMIFSSFNEITFNENHIKQLHRVLLKYSTKDERHRGEYKKFANNVEAFGPDGKSKGIIFKSASPFDTPNLMKNLVDWTNTQITQKDLHPLLILSIFVLVFLHIHPFQDGNGRLSRALTTLLLLKLGYSYVPYSSFERVIEESKEAYYLALRRGQSDLEKKAVKNLTGIKDWFVFFLKSMLKQKISLESKIKTEFELIQISPLSKQIIEITRSRGSTSVSEIVTITAANRNTVKLHLKKLVEDGYLISEGAGRGTRYRSC